MLIVEQRSQRGAADPRPDGPDSGSGAAKKVSAIDLHVMFEFYLHVTSPQFVSYRKRQQKRA